MPLRLLCALSIFLPACLYHVPFTERLSEAKHSQAVAAEQEARHNGWDGAWDLRIHSWDT